MKKGIILLFFAVFLAFSSEACECIFGKHTLREWAKGYKYIFYAEVKEIVDPKIRGFENTMTFLHDASYVQIGGYHPKLKVKEIFKGNVQEYIQDGYLTMNNGWSLCGDFFKPGDKILFFAYEGSEGTLATSTCSLNRRYLTDEDFLIERREVKKATRGKFIGIF